MWAGQGLYFSEKDIYIKINSTTEMILMLGLWNFALTGIIKYDHKICDIDNNSALVEICDKY